MPNINLIAQKRAEKERLEKSVRSVFLLMSGLSACAIALFIFLSAQWLTINNKISKLEQELDKLEPTVAKIREFDQKTRDLQPKIDLYTKAREHTMGWYTFLQVVARSMPENTWLTRLGPGQVAQTPAGQQPPPANIRLAGVTVNQQLVGETMLNLDRYHDLMEEVSLNYTQNGMVGDIPTVEFEVAAKLKNLPSAFFVKGPESAKEGADTDGNKG